MLTKTEDLKRRTKEYALRIIKLVEALPKTAIGRAIGNHGCFQQYRDKEAVILKSAI